MWNNDVFDQDKLGKGIPVFRVGRKLHLRDLLVYHLESLVSWKNYGISMALCVAAWGELAHCCLGPKNIRLTKLLLFIPKPVNSVYWLS